MVMQIHSIDAFTVYATPERRFVATNAAPLFTLYNIFF